jgi:hypothetical protein
MSLQIMLCEQFIVTMAHNSGTLIFDTFCASLGFELQVSSSCVPQQNGFVECKNQTLVPIASTMLNDHETHRKVLGQSDQHILLCLKLHFSFSFLKQFFFVMVWMLTQGKAIFV